MSCSPHSFTLKCVYIVNNNPRRRAHKLTNILTRVHYPQPTRTLTRINQPDSTGSSSNAALSLSLSFTGRFCRSPSPLSRRSARVMSIAPETKSCFKITFIVFTDRKWMVKKKKKINKKNPCDIVRGDSYSYGFRRGRRPFLFARFELLYDFFSPSENDTVPACNDYY